MKKITTLLFAICSVISFQAQTVFINEIHYDNAGGDVDEAVEIAGPAGTDLTGWTLQPYNGSGGLAYGSISLSGTISNESNGYGTLNFFFPPNGLQNGAPDGIALIDDSNNVVQFLSYEGDFTATDGPAAGMTSVDIGVEETSSTPIGESLQLIGSGNEYSDFTWSGPSASSPGSINSGQSFLAPPPPPSGLCSTDTPQAIEDFTTTTSVVSIGDTGIIGEDSFQFTFNNINLDLQHDRASDMVMTLTSPEGTVLTLFENNGGVDGLDTQANLVFDDAGASVGTWVGGAPAASYSALGGLFNTVFAGEEVNGDWTLTISDQGGQTDEGTLFGFCLDITDNGLIGTIPQISCPGDIDTETDEGLCGAEVTFGPASAIDAEDGALAVTQTAGPTSGDFLAVGTYDVTYEATDSNGNTVECTFTITITDEEAPVAVGQDITVTLDAMGLGSITAADVDGGSTDNCGIDVMTLSQSNFDCSDVGDNQVTLTVEDEEGNTDSVIFTVTVVDDLAPVITCVGSAFGLEVFINEIHYDNAGSDENEAVEIAGPEGTDLTGWSIVLYNGSNGQAYDTENLTGVIADQNNGFGTLNFPISGIQNGSPDGIALIDDTNNVLQFISYEGTLTATDGPAAGMTSQDIGVSEASSTPIGESLQLSGTGTFYADFTWNGPAASTPGAINNGQSFVAAPSSPSFQLVLVEGTATMQAADFLGSIDEACGYTVTVDGEDFINFTCTDIGSHEFEVTVEDASGNISTCTAFVDVVDPSLYCELACSELENPVDILDFEPVAEVADETNEGVIGANSFEYTFNSISIDLQHDRASDLVVSLTSPSGTSVVLTENNGGVDGLDAQAVLIFDDMAGSNVTTWSGGAPAASYMAEGGMLNDVFAGEDVNGDWTLSILDGGGEGDEGVLYGFCLDITNNGLVGSVPAISCPGEVDIVADANTCGAIVNFSPAAAIDLEDGPLAVTQVSGPASGDLVEVGVYTVVFEATDSDGNTVTCDFTFEVEDTQDPVAMTQDITVSLDASGMAVITADDVDGGSTDNCADITLSIDTTTFDCGNVGIDNEVTLTVTDASGNTDTAIAIVTVIDDIAPVIACVGGSAFGVEVFINEIHYDNAGADEDEAIEIAGPEGTNLENWTLVLYNGANGLVYHTENLTGTIPNQNNGFGTLNFPIEGIQNGAPDGIALVDDTNTVVQFLSYEGTMVAEDGPATGMTSQDIGVFEPGSTPIGESLQLTGTGTFYGDFIWNSPAAWSPGDVNAGQTFEEATVGAPYSIVLDADGLASIAAQDLIIGVEEACSYQISFGPPSGINECGDNLGAPISNTLDPTTSAISITESGVLGEDFNLSNISVDITHTWTGDLTLELTSPNGSTLLLSDANGGSGDNYTNTVFADGGDDITAATAPFTGTFAPQGGTFADTFTGEDISGDWTLTVTDGVGGDDGVLNDFCISFEALSSSVMELTCENVGMNEIEVTVTDASGNSTSCFALVEVIDNIAPVLVCQDIDLSIGEDGTVTLDPMDLLDMDNTVEACGLEVVTADITEFDCLDIGSTVEVTVFAQDPSGNIASCTAMVTIVDTVAPVVTCPDDLTVDPDATGVYTLEDFIASGAASAVDNCSEDVTLTQTPAPGTQLGVGTYTITISAEDEFGNVGTCEFELIVDIVSGTEDNILSGAVVMYPNPAGTFVNLRNNSQVSLTEATIFDISGKLVNKVDLTQMGVEQRIDISGLASGVYMVNISSADATTVKRLIKK